MIIKLDPKLMQGQKPKFPIFTYNKHAIIAGGSIRRWFTGETQDSDVDVFFDTISSLDDSIKKVQDECLFENKNSFTFARAGHNIQFIKIITGSVKEVFDKFDFQHCCFAYDGTDIYSTESAITCALRKTLRINNIQKGFELDTLRRAFKYQKQGFSPCLGTLNELGASFRKVTRTQLKNQTEISPGGGRRVVRFD